MQTRSNEAITLLERFLQEVDGRLLASRWIETSSLQAYIRVNQRWLEGRVMKCLDIARIEVVPSLRQHGLFSSFIIAAHEHHPYEATYLEHATNPIVIAWCNKYAWQQDTSAHPPSFYRMKA
jgi:hypothetical protein